MTRHFHNAKFNKIAISGDLSKLGNLKYFLKEERIIDDQIKKEFPISNYGNPEDSLLVRGIIELMHAYETVDQEKLDLVESLGNIEYLGLADTKQIILNFKDEITPITATEIYDFTNSFLDDVFHMGKFTKFCIDRDLKDLLRDNIENLLNTLKDTERQFRFLKDEDSYYLRGVTSTKYQNYDNHLAIYLSLLALHSYAKKNNTIFTIEEAILSDSEIKIFFEQEKPIHIPDFGDLYFGAYVSNNEIREKAFSLEMRYKIVNSKGKSFSGLYSLDDAIFNLAHHTKIENFKEKISNIFNLDDLKQITLEHIYAIKSADKLTENVLFSLIEKIVRSTQKLNKSTREKARKMHSERVINSTMTIIEVFNRMSEITTDIEEKLYLERIYHEVIASLK